jgi:hypothetical protein
LLGAANGSRGFADAAAHLAGVAAVRYQAIEGKPAVVAQVRGPGLDDRRRRHLKEHGYRPIVGAAMNDLWCADPDPREVRRRCLEFSRPELRAPARLGAKSEDAEAATAAESAEASENPGDSVPR